MSIFVCAHMLVRDPLGRMAAALRMGTALRPPLSCTPRNTKVILLMLSAIAGRLPVCYIYIHGRHHIPSITVLLDLIFDLFPNHQSSRHHTPQHHTPFTHRTPRAPFHPTLDSTVCTYLRRDGHGTKDR